MKRFLKNLFRKRVRMPRVSDVEIAEMYVGELER